MPLGDTPEERAEHALSTFAEARRLLVVHSQHWKALLLALRHAKAVEPIVAHLNLLDEEGIRIAVDAPVFNVVLGACARGGRADEAVAWIGKMKALGTEPDSDSYGCLIIACASAGRPSEAALWVDKAVKAGFNVSAINYNRLIVSYADAARMTEVNAWLRKLKESHIEILEWTYAEIIRKCAEERDELAAKSWMEVIRRE
eukprot:1604356-Amphidinium_carterae.1